MPGLFNDVSGAVQGVESWVEQQWSTRIIQVSVYASIVFLLLSSYDLISVVDKAISDLLNLKLGKEGTRVLHAAIFGLFIYVGTRFILDPIVTKLHLGGGNVVEGMDEGVEVDGADAYEGVYGEGGEDAEIEQDEEE